MGKLLLARLGRGLVEAVHVELADERGKVVVLEVVWEDALGEAVLFMKKRRVRAERARAGRGEKTRRDQTR